MAASEGVRLKKSERQIRGRLEPRVAQFWHERIPFGSAVRNQQLLFWNSARTAKRRRSHLLELFARRFGLDADPDLEDTEAHIALPERFSFIENPEQTLAVFREAVEAMRRGPRRIVIDQRKCVLIDICAAAVLNTLALEAHRTIGNNYAGFYPGKGEALEIVVATGLPKVLGVKLPPMRHFRKFHVRKGPQPKTSLLAPTWKERVGSELTEYLAACFKRCGHRLTREGRKRIGKLLGEVLANAEDHASGNPWFITGYLRQPAERAFGDCHITVFNFGPTIAETLQGLPAGGYRTDVESLVQEHRQRRLFGLVRPKWSEQGLWTVYALQEGVSRLNAPGTSRGVGTADMIEEFQKLGRTAGNGPEPRMSLLSGNIHILFDGRHRIQLEEMEASRPRRIIAFNETNDLLEPPDDGAVTHLEHGFPGTLLSLRFYIDQRYLKDLEAAR